MTLDHGTLQWVAKPVTRKQGVRILERDRFRCQYCGLDGTASFENALVMGVDFVVARACKGKNDPRNLVACCRPCNVIKGRRLFGSFEESKEYVLSRREVLRGVWESHTEPTPKKRPPKSRVKLATVLAPDTDVSLKSQRLQISEEDDFFPELGGEG